MNKRIRVLFDLSFNIERETYRCYNDERMNRHLIGSVLMKKLFAALILLICFSSFVALAVENEILTFEDLYNNPEKYTGQTVRVIARILDFEKQDKGNFLSNDLRYIYHFDMHVQKDDGTFAPFRKNILMFHNEFRKIGGESIHTMFSLKRGWDLDAVLKVRYDGDVIRSDIISIKPYGITGSIGLTVVIGMFAMGFAAFFAFLFWMMKLEKRKKDRIETKRRSMLNELESLILYTELIDVSSEVIVDSRQSAGETLSRAWLGEQLGGDFGAIIGAATTPREYDVRTGNEIYTFIVRNKNGGAIIDRVKASDDCFPIYISKLK